MILVLFLLTSFCYGQTKYTEYGSSQCYVNSIQHSGDRIDNPIFNGGGFIGSYTGPECAAFCDDLSNTDEQGRTCVAFEHSSQDYNAVASCALAWGCDYTKSWSGGNTYVKKIQYHVADSQLSLPSARSYCHYRGGFLAKPQDETDRNSIRTLLPSGNVRAWLGIYQTNDMTWLRDNGESMGWTNWKSGEGNDKRGVTAGAAMVWQSGWSGEWYDMPNYDGRVHYVVCELPSSSGRRALLSTDCGNDYVLVGETHAEVEPECDQYGCPEVDSCDACKDVCDSDDSCEAYECNFSGDTISCSFNGHLTTTEECGPLCESQTVCVKNSTQIDGTNFVSAESNNRRQLWPLVGGPQNPVCYSGYQDKTNGNAYWWACGVSCPGGQYWTDYLCNCACQKEIEYHVASSQMTLPSARSYCHKKGGFLVKPRNEADTNSIKALLPSGNVRAWLGIYQRSDMTWLRDNGDSMGWTNWKSGEGNDRRGVTAGAAMVWQSGWSGEWYDMPNYDGRVHYVVCELSGRRALVALEEENFVQSESRLLENERKM